MRSLNKLFGNVFEDHQSYYSKPPSDSCLTAFLGDKNNIVPVALEEYEIIGEACSLPLK